MIIGSGIYLSGGRYISTDNAYVGAQKVLITPDISGKITRVAVREGQHVKPGDELFEIDREPFPLVLTQAKAKLATARTDFAKLKTNLKSLKTLAELAQKTVELKQHDVERKTTLASRRPARRPISTPPLATVVTAQLQAEFAIQQRDTTLNQLLGDPDLPIENDFRPMRRPRRRSTRPSAISTTRSCARRSPARRRRSTTSSSAASSPPARRCSA